MSEESRTHRSLKNAKVALIYYFINLILQFFSRKIFLDYLGSEVLGLNTTAMNLLQFLNLAELGIGSAISYSLYKPLACQDYKQVGEIVSVQGFFYRRIGIIVLLASLILMSFFSFFFDKADIPIWYAYATFIVLLISTLASYFFNYRQIVFTADQKDYKLNYVTQNIKSAKIVLQMLCLIYLSNGYLWWLGWELIATLITVWGINYILYKEYPWLVTSVLKGKILRMKYPQITIKTKQLFFHKIGSFALLQTSPVIIYAYTSLTLVAIYGNYMLVIAGVMALLNAIFNSMNAGVGNLVAGSSREQISSFFYELFSCRFLLVATICFSLYILLNPFIILWVGQDYLLDHTSIVLLIIILYINTMRNVVDSFINAYGLFQDIWAPIVEATLNIGGAIVLGYYYGLNGVLFGILLSLFLVIFCWKPYFLFRARRIDITITRYLVLYTIHFSILVVSSLAVYAILSLMEWKIAGFVDLFFYGITVSLLFSITLFIPLYLLTDGMRLFVKRLKRLFF